MIYLPTIKQLQYLVALHRTGHFGKAADDCHVTQSTLSAGLRELETLLGVTLVERNRRTVRFTPLGEAVVTRAWRLVKFIDNNMLGTTKCSKCGGHFVTEAYENARHYECGLCTPPARAGKGAGNGGILLH